MGEVSKNLIKDVTSFKAAMSNAIALFVVGGDDKVTISKEDYARADPIRERLDVEADRIFFDHLWRQVEARWKDKARGDGENTEIYKAARLFRHELLRISKDLLKEALDGLPCPAAYRHRARVRAENRFLGSVHKNYPELKQREEEATEDAV